MRIKTNVRFMQEGGAVDDGSQEAAPEANAPEQEQGQEQGQEQDPVVILAQMAQQALKNNDGQLALKVCEGFLQFLQQMQQQQGAEQQAPQGEPVYRKGGKLIGRI